MHAKKEHSPPTSRPPRSPPRPRSRRAGRRSPLRARLRRSRQRRTRPRRPPGIGLRSDTLGLPPHLARRLPACPSARTSSRPTAPRSRPAFTELRRQLKVSLQFPDDVLVEAKRAARSPRLPTRTRPHSRSSPSTRSRRWTSTRRSTSSATATGTASATRSPTWPRSSSRAARWTSRRTSAARRSTPRTRTCASTRPCSRRAPRACCPTRPARGRLDDGRRRHRRGSAVHVGRSLVRSRAKLDYVSAQQALDGGTAEEQLRLLREVGILRLQREERRGGVSLPLPEQVITEENGEYGLRFRAPLRSRGGTPRSR